MGSDSMQFGFKKGVSTTQCACLVTEDTTYFMRMGTALLLDFSKAFDKQRFDKLFEKLLNIYFSAELDDFLRELRMLQLGCHIICGMVHVIS